MGDAWLRVSDADREQAVVALREHLVAGRLTLEEFCDRVDAALRAKVTGDLAQVHDDLPEAPHWTAGSRRKPARFTSALRRDWGLDAGQPDAPTIHVRVLGFAGTIDVWRVPRDMRANSYREIIRALHPRPRVSRQAGEPG
jgi:hypothetical protein